VDTILLDAGGVLVWPNWARVADALRARGIAADAMRMAAADPYARHALDVPEIINGSTDQRRGVDYFNFVLTHAGVSLSEATASALAEIQQYHRVLNVWEHVPEFVVPTLRMLKERGDRLVVVSNSNGTLRAALTRLGLIAFFDLVIDSAEEGLEKPDRRLFELALSRAGASPSETIHVGDMYYVDVVGARAAGISPVLVDEAGLKADADCRRIRSIADLPPLVARFLRPGAPVPGAPVP
jgi:HAD superfamily hydrolase (TIGR01549 family)